MKSENLILKKKNEEICKIYQEKDKSLKVMSIRLETMEKENRTLQRELENYFEEITRLKKIYLKP